MKKLSYLTISLCLVLLVHCATEQKAIQPSGVAKEKCDAPVWNVGDSWRYVYSNTREWEYKVVKVEEESYVVDDRYGAYKPCFDKKTLEVLAFIDSEGIKRPSLTSLYYFDFPLYVGKRWKKMVSGTPIGGTVEINYLNEFTVVSHERVSVVAGTFKSFKIEVKQTNMGGQFASGKVYLWYSPEVKFVVKLEYEKIAYWRNQRNFELISFKLQ